MRNLVKMYHFVFALLLLISGCAQDRVIQTEQQKVDVTKFHDLYQASKALKAATQTGVTSSDYNKMVRDCRTQWMIVKDGRELTSEEQRVVAAYKEAIDVHADAARLWSLRSDMWRKTSDIFANPDKVMLLNGEAFSIVEKYPDVYVATPTWNRRIKFIVFDSALQALWAEGGQKLSTADALLEPRHAVEEVSTLPPDDYRVGNYGTVRELKRWGYSTTQIKQLLDARQTK